MNFKELKHHADCQNDFEVRVISHAGSRFYQVEMEDAQGERHLLTQRGKPILFRALDDVHLELKRAGIHRAYLVHFDAHDEMIGHAAHYHEPLSSRMPLAF